VSIASRRRLFRAVAYSRPPFPARPASRLEQLEAAFAALGQCVPVSVHAAAATPRPLSRLSSAGNRRCSLPIPAVAQLQRLGRGRFRIRTRATDVIRSSMSPRAPGPGTRWVQSLARYRRQSVFARSTTGYQASAESQRASFYNAAAYDPSTALTQLDTSPGIAGPEMPETLNQKTPKQDAQWFNEPPGRTNGLARFEQVRRAHRRRSRPQPCKRLDDAGEAPGQTCPAGYRA